MKYGQDEAIDRALATLGEAEPPQGMEARIVARLNAASQPQPRAFGWWSVAAFAAMAALLLAVAVHEFRPAPHAASVASVQGTTSPPGSRVDMPQEIFQTHNARPTLWPLKTAASDHRRAPRKRAISSHMELVSFPAPAEPLTQQEKLLLRVARRGDQEDFDLLNPETVEMAMARERADFDQFLQTVHKK